MSHCRSPAQCQETPCTPEHQFAYLQDGRREGGRRRKEGTCIILCVPAAGHNSYPIENIPNWPLTCCVSIIHMDIELVT